MEAMSVSVGLLDDAGSRKVADAAALKGAKVMVIDDSNTIRRSAEIFLLQAGCTVILADDGFDALAKITDHQPNVIFVEPNSLLMTSSPQTVRLPAARSSARLTAVFAIWTL